MMFSIPGDVSDVREDFTTFSLTRPVPSAALSGGLVQIQGCYSTAILIEWNLFVQLQFSCLSCRH